MSFIRPILIILISMCMLSACNPARRSTAEQATRGQADAQQVSLPVAVLQPDASAEIKNASSLPLAATDPLLDGLHDIVSRRRTNLLARHGWLHIITRNTGKENDLASLWGPLPETWQEEEWLDLDSSGSEMRAVKRLLNDGLQPIQNSIWNNHLWRNLTIGLEQPANGSLDLPDSFDPNYGYYDVVIRLIRQGHPISKGTIYKECWYQGEQYSISDGEYKYEAVFNPDKLSLRWIKTWKLSAGSIVPVKSKEILVEERANQPPSEILVLLKSAQILSLK